MPDPLYPSDKLIAFEKLPLSQLVDAYEAEKKKLSAVDKAALTGAELKAYSIELTRLSCYHHYAAVIDTPPSRQDILNVIAKCEDRAGQATLCRYMAVLNRQAKQWFKDQDKLVSKAAFKAEAHSFVKVWHELLNQIVTAV